MDTMLEKIFEGTIINPKSIIIQTKHDREVAYYLTINTDAPIDSEGIQSHYIELYRKRASKPIASYTVLSDTLQSAYRDLACKIVEECTKDANFVIKGLQHAIASMYLNNCFEEKFEEEFDMEYTDTHRFLVESNSILQPGEDLFERFGLIGKIKIRGRKGKIVIERIEE